MKRWLCALLAVVLLVGMFPSMALRIAAAEEMTSSQEMVDVLKKMEGFLKRAKWDYGQYTVGYGTRCPDDMLDEYDEKTGRDITEEEAEALLREHLNSFEKQVNKFMTKYGLQLEQHQFDALVSFTYNCGGAWTRDVNGYFNTAVRNGDLGSAFIYGIGLFSKAGSDYILIKRRLAEANMYLNGEYKACNKDPDPYPDTYKYVFLAGNGGKVNYEIHAYDAALNAGIVTSFSKIPVGVDENGTPFVYEFAGWYTAATGGTKVETLDGSLKNGAVLYAQWKDPAGQIVDLPTGDAVDNLELTLSGSVNVRSGPGTFYSKVNKLSTGSKITITEVYVNGSSTWGKMTDGNWLSLSYTDYEDVLAASKAEKDLPCGGTVTGENVNVRSGPGTSNAMQYQLNTGDRVVITEIQEGGSLVWGKLEDGNWICMTYVTLDATEEETAPTVTGIEVIKTPDRLEYVQMQDALDPAGGIVKVLYSDGSIGALSMTRAMITTYSNEKLGETTVKITHEGFKATFTVNIIKATVTFLNYDGTVLSSAQYAYGETVELPQPPEKPEDEAGKYAFIGWDKEVTTCAGDATYTAVFELYIEKFAVTFVNYDGTILSTAEYALGDAVTEPETPTKPADEAGEYVFIGWDKEVTACEGETTYTAVYELIEKYTVTFVNYDGTVLSTAEYALGDTVVQPEAPTKPADEAGEYIFAGWDQEVTACEGETTYTAVFECVPRYILGDFDGNEIVNEDDAIYLLRYTFFPEDFPVETPADFTGDGIVNEDDAIYLLRYTFFPEDFPLTDSST